MRYEQVRDALLHRFAEPFPAPEWRRPWAEGDAAFQPQADLPAHTRGGS
jgi:hypothetical protein